MKSKFNITYLSMFFCLIVVPNQHVFAEQKTIFCAESMQHGSNTWGYCQTFCSQYAPSNCIENELKNGWKIDIVHPKQVSGYESCVCIGQQYVLSKNNEKAQRLGGESVKELQLLKKENELLKKEVSMLKDELNSIKKKP